jgi:poly(hydroxyalkanoate) depolymerase family esterase
MMSVALSTPAIHTLANVNAAPQLYCVLAFAPSKLAPRPLRDSDLGIHFHTVANHRLPPATLVHGGSHSTISSATGRRRMSIAKVLSMAAVCLSLTAPNAHTAYALTGSLNEDPNFGANPGGLRMFTYVPAGVGPNRPLVVALHGCLQSARDFYRATGWADLADTLGFSLLLPQQPFTENPGWCFNWYAPENQKPGKGAPASIANMIEKMKEDHDIDEKSIFVTGLSGGAAMTEVMIATYPELFAGAAVLASPPFACAQAIENDPLLSTRQNALQHAMLCMSHAHPDKNSKEWATLVLDAKPGYSGKRPVVSIWIGSDDSIVAPGNLKEDLEQWTGVSGLPETPATQQETITGAMNSRSHQAFTAEHQLYGKAGRPQVETYLIKGAGHGVPIDAANGCGVNISNNPIISQNPFMNNFMIDVGICAVRRIADFWGIKGPTR